MEFTKQKLIELLIKKASGFYYTESQFEYEKTSKPKTASLKSTSKKNISKKCNNIVTTLTDEKTISPNICDNDKTFKSEISDIIDTNIKSECDKVENVNNDENNQCFSDTVQSDCVHFDDNMVLSNEGGDNFDLSLIKKKVTTHFVAPDMIAIKILFEIFDRKVDDNDLDNISDDELMNLKTKLLEEIKNEDY